jgi:putative flippase GtrA
MVFCPWVVVVIDLLLHRKKILMLKDSITGLIDFFYPPFRKYMNLQTFRYAVCGGGNTLLDIFLYWLSFHYIFHQADIHVPIFGAISAKIAAFLFAFAISFPTGYLLNKNIVFPGSSLHGRVQLFRYFVLVVICITLNYVCITLFVDEFGIYPTVAKALTTIIVVSFSYLTQKKFTFKIENAEEKSSATPTDNK